MDSGHRQIAFRFQFGKIIECNSQPAPMHTYRPWNSILSAREMVITGTLENKGLRSTWLASVRSGEQPHSKWITCAHVQVLLYLSVAFSF